MRYGRQNIVLLFAVLLLLTTCTLTRHSSLQGPLVEPCFIPLSVHYITDQTDIRKKFNEALEKSNEKLNPHGIGLVVWSEDHLYRLPKNIKTTQDRQILSSRVYRDGTLHVFFVDTVYLDHGNNLNGLHTSLGSKERDFVILSNTARDSTLAHEVGHVLGLSHSSDEDNMMNPDRIDSISRFTPEQGSEMQSSVREYLTRDW